MNKFTQIAFKFSFIKDPAVNKHRLGLKLAFLEFASFLIDLEERPWKPFKYKA